MLPNYRNVSESEIDEWVEVLTTDFRDAVLASVLKIVLGVMLLVTCLLGTLVSLGSVIRSLELSEDS